MYVGSKVLPKPMYQEIHGPLCGSNFINYPSRSRFMVDKKRSPHLVVLHRGKCKKICQIYAPVCASDMKTYHNECQLQYAKKNNKKLHAKFRGKCSMLLLTHSRNITNLVGEDYYFGSVEEEPFDPDKCVLHC